MSERQLKNVAASVRQRLLNLARASDEDFQKVLLRYAIERLLYRLACSPHRRRFVLKGATLFALWSDAPRGGDPREERRADAGGPDRHEILYSKIRVILAWQRLVYQDSPSLEDDLVLYTKIPRKPGVSESCIAMLRGIRETSGRLKALF